MTKSFQFFETNKLSEVLAIACIDDEGSFTVDYRFDRANLRLWIVRGLKSNMEIRFIECFEFRLKSNRWGLRGWAEEDTIPFIDCPIEFLSIASSCIHNDWRRKVYQAAFAPAVIPMGAWLHCSEGLLQSDGRIIKDIQKVESGFIDVHGESVSVTPEIVRSLLLTGNGIAYGIA